MNLILFYKINLCKSSPIGESFGLLFYVEKRWGIWGTKSPSKFGNKGNEKFVHLQLWGTVKLRAEYGLLFWG